jgi:hypothetical protein
MIKKKPYLYKVSSSNYFPKLQNTPKFQIPNSGNVVWCLGIPCILTPTLLIMAICLGVFLSLVAYQLVSPFLLFAVASLKVGL